MELLQVKDLSFTYPKQPQKALEGLSFSIQKGEFVLVCGESGCGKTTLLRLMKRETTPFGEQEGEILYDSVPLCEMDSRRSAGAIGFVGQRPDEQIVTDKVWHELAFGLENLGVPKSVIRRRVGEMASYFGIQDWYHKSTDELSGGQKQLLNLAAVMVMQPDLLILDEPTSQLDPIAASDFIATLQKLNRELGLTILLAEHRMEEVFPIAGQVLVLEQGRLCFDGTAQNACVHLKEHPLACGLPSAARIWGGLSVRCECPMTVKAGRELLETHFAGKAGATIEQTPASEKEAAIEAKGLWFRYEKNLPDVLRGADILVQNREIYSILGGNGTGKTTLLHVLAGLDRPYKGKARINGKKISEYKNNSLYRRGLALLPQDPQTVFLKNTVREDFEEILKAMGVDRQEFDQRIAMAADRLCIDGLLSRHPYDLSGGEQQKCALVKLLLTEPRILLLDEPTKGMDALSKARFAELLRCLREDGKTILMVTHDVEFAAQVSDRCALFFDGEIISTGCPNEFFSGNHFYTTAASRMARGLFPNAVLCEEVTALCNGERPSKNGSPFR
ncbi:MAG: energy-coupling factor ABC transporter ATP-binding protein [Clostridiales bacterium]|nr:energy-coupling factor ABC transporter ATP-binding protein [Clostridiales bacterium]